MAEILKQKIAENLKTALKSGKGLEISTLRMLLAAVANKEIELRKKDVGLSDKETSAVISQEAKKRKDAATEFRKGKRQDLAEKEEAELKILQTYLPPEISETELLRVIKDGVREAGANSDKDFAKVMKIIMPTLKGKASGDRISKVLKEELGKAR